MNKFTSILTCLVAFAGIVNCASAEDRRPDIVFIIVDDLNDWEGCLGGHPNAKSPHIDSLAASGMLFSQAYCNSPQCRPSRTSLNYGVYPFHTGRYFNATGPNEAKITTPTMQRFFTDSGYRVVSGGKVFHGGPGRVGDARFQKPKDHKVDPDEWTNLANKPEHKETKKRLAKMIPENQHPGLNVQSWFDKRQK